MSYLPVCLRWGLVGFYADGVGVPRRVFLSHTSELSKWPESRTFVKAAEEAVARAGDAVAEMAYFTARDSKPAAYCREVVRRCQVWVGIIGFRYGSLVRDKPDVSHVEVEFEEATTSGLLRLAFLLDEKLTVVMPRGALFDAEFDQRQQEFRMRLTESGLTVYKVRSPDELELRLHQALLESGSGSSPAGAFGAAGPGAGAVLPGLPVMVAKFTQAAVVPRQLPPPPALFTGRGSELARLSAVLAEPGDQGGSGGRW